MIPARTKSVLDLLFEAETNLAANPPGQGRRLKIGFDLFPVFNSEPRLTILEAGSFSLSS